MGPVWVRTHKDPGARLGHRLLGVARVVTVVILASLVATGATEFNFFVGAEFESTAGAATPTVDDRPADGWAQGLIHRHHGWLLEVPRLDYHLTPVAKGGKSTLEQAILGPIPGCDERLLLDTSACTLPGLGFRGVLRPRRVTVQRLGFAEHRKDRLLFRLTLDGIERFDGLLRTDSINDVWVPARGTMQTLIATVAVSWVEDRAADPLLLEAELLPAHGGRAELQLDHPTKGFGRLSADGFRLHGDELGAITSVEMLGRVRSVLEPPPTTQAAP